MDSSHSFRWASSVPGLGGLLGEAPFLFQVNAGGRCRHSAGSQAAQRQKLQPPQAGAGERSTRLEALAGQALCWFSHLLDLIHDLV